MSSLKVEAKGEHAIVQLRVPKTVIDKVKALALAPPARPDVRITTPNFDTQFGPR
jgi:hypothetical protein